MNSLNFKFSNFFSKLIALVSGVVLVIVAYNHNNQSLYVISGNAYGTTWSVTSTSYIGDHYKNKGLNNIEIYAESYVALNGRINKRFVNPKIDLLKEKRGFNSKHWIIDLNEEINYL